MAQIKIDGVPYAVLDNLGFQHSVGVYAKEVQTPEGPKMAVRSPGSNNWRFWIPTDRLRPGSVVTGQGRPEEQT